MAHLALLLEADPARRERFAARLQRLFASLPAVRIGTASAGDLICVWAAGPTAPLDVQADGDSLALLIGYAVDDAGRWLTARELAAAWLAPAGPRTAHDGYHVAVAADPARGLAVGVDPLGMFPLYHAALAGGGSLVATTPAAFCCHPDFQPRLDRTGLAGILLAHGLLDNRPLLDGTRRLAAGHRLRARPGGSPEEELIFDLAGLPSPADETLLDAQVHVGDLLLDTLRRHRPPGDDSLIMLSGGLDSRLVAGCLAESGIATRAVSFGRPADYEVRAARQVAAQVGMPHEVVSTEELSQEMFLAAARRAVRFSHLSSGPGGDDFAAGLRMAARGERFLWSGIPFDWVFEPISRLSGYDAATDSWSFDRLLGAVNLWGVSGERLPGLLGADGQDRCREVVERMRAVCLGGPLPPQRQSALVRWDQRVRNHLAEALHLTSFTAWPLTPATDRRFFSAIFSLPVATTADRRLEKAILLERRPDLAAIPLDANSFQFEPLAAGPRCEMRGAARSLGRRLRRAVQPWWPGADPRRYERLFNVDHPRWLAVRRAVEPLRPLLHEHLDAGALAAVLPPAGRRLRSRTAVKSGGAVRLLCGLALLLDELEQREAAGR